MFTWRLATAVVVAAAVMSGPDESRAQEALPIFRASVSLVPITAVVRDGKNRVVRDLGREDFQVFEDSRQRRVVDFSAMEQGPVTLGLVFDTSGSMRGPNLSKGQAVVSALLDRLDHASDEAALFTFDKAIRAETPFTNERHRIREALDRTEGWGLTSLYDAIAETAKQVAQRRGSRRAVVVITDGVDTSSEMTLPDVSGLASAIDVPVYIFTVDAVPSAGADKSIAPREDTLLNLARWTGGDQREVSSLHDAAPAVAALMTELRQQYFLAIESASASGWYRLDVRTRRKGLTVRARSGYFAATEPSTESPR
jgi:Ca-activated chloride channel family protein